MELISVVIPVYNGMNVLAKCIRSVLNQSYTELELILIDDGSTDETSEICDWYASRDSRVRVYHIENCGVSRARNVALEHIRGNYLYFADADDYLERMALEHLMNAMKKQDAALSVCRYYKTYNGRRVSNFPLEFPGIYNKMEYYVHTMKDPGHHYYGVLWNKMYRADIIQKHHLRFHTDVTLGEDFIFNLEYLDHVRTVVVLGEALYNYCRSGPDTLSRKAHSSIQDCRCELNNRKKIYEIYIALLKKYELYEKYKGKIQQYWIMFYIRQRYQLKYCTRDWSKQDRKEWYHVLRTDTMITGCVKRVAWNILFCKKTCFNLKTLLKSLVKKCI